MVHVYIAEKPLQYTCLALNFLQVWTPGIQFICLFNGLNQISHTGWINNSYYEVLSLVTINNIYYEVYVFKTK